MKNNEKGCLVCIYCKTIIQANFNHCVRAYCKLAKKNIVDTILCSNEAKLQKIGIPGWCPKELKKTRPTLQELILLGDKGTPFVNEKTVIDVHKGRMRFRDFNGKKITHTAGFNKDEMLKILKFGKTNMKQLKSENEFRVKSLFEGYLKHRHAHDE